MSDHPMG